MTHEFEWWLANTIPNASAEVKAAAFAAWNARTPRPEGTALTPFGEALELLETCQHNDPDTRYEIATGFYKDPDNPSDVRLRDVVRDFLAKWKQPAPQPGRP